MAIAVSIGIVVSTAKRGRNLESKVWKSVMAVV